MKRLFDHDPQRGITEYFHYDPNTEEWAIETVQDQQPMLDAAAWMRNDPEQSKEGIKSGMWHYAHLTDIVLLKMIQEDGVNPYDPNNSKKVFQLVNTKYEYCKLTDGKHQAKA